MSVDHLGESVLGARWEHHGSDDQGLTEACLSLCLRGVT